MRVATVFVPGGSTEAAFLLRGCRKCRQGRQGGPRGLGFHHHGSYLISSAHRNKVRVFPPAFPSSKGVQTPQAFKENGGELDRSKGSKEKPGDFARQARSSSGSDQGVSTSGRGEDRGGEENTLSGIPYLWRSIPVRYQVIIGMALAFVTCNMDRVNISVAIIPMSIDYDWSPTQMGLVQSAFFYGYLVAQIPGGWLANKFGGEKVLPFGVFLWSVATVAVPFLAGDMGGLYLSRAAVGLGEGISPPAAVDVIARTVPVNERSRATTFVFGSMHVGTISGLLLAPVLIKTVGWPSVFIVFGSLGLVWCKWFDDFNSRNKLGNVDQVQKALSADGKAIEGEKEAEEKKMAVAKTTKDKHKQGGGGGKIPWLQFANNTPIRALAYIHFCNNWAQYTILAWLPTFYKDSLGIELTEAAQLSLLPAAMGIVVSLVAAPLADGLVEKGVGVTWVRKFVQSVAFLGPSACMVACMLDSQDQQLVTWLLPVGIGLQAFSLAGLYCNHQDISPRYAAVLSGATHIFGSLPGVFGVPFTGWLLDHTDHSWNLSMFLPCLFFYLSGCVVFLKWGSGEEVAFDLENTVK